MDKVYSLTVFNLFYRIRYRYIIITFVFRVIDSDFGDMSAMGSIGAIIYPDDQIVLCIKGLVLLEL